MLPEPKPVTIECQGHQLVGLIDGADETAKCAVIIVVGGPQYRVGSHRQFALLARDLASAGYPTLRFDHRGIGDSTGSTTFESLDPDIRAAIDVCQALCPGIESVVLWGLCDAASAIMMYAHTDARVSGVVLLNPWARDEQTQAKSVLSAYYLRRLASGDFWKKLLSGRVRAFRSLRDFLSNLRRSLGGSREPQTAKSGTEDFRLRMMNGLRAYQGNVLFILSGNDLTASEFRLFVNGVRSYRRLLERSRTRVVEFPQADHTFSSAEWRNQIADWTKDWLGTLDRD